MKKTSVIFRTFKKNNGDVIALFPFIPSDNHGWYCESYMHVGQHSGASQDIVRRGMTRPSTTEEITPLLNELIRIGYTNLRILKRFPHNAYDVRRELCRDA